MIDAANQASAYLKQTEVATRQLFTALEYYNQLLIDIRRPILVRDVTTSDDHEVIFKQWQKQNENKINAALERERQYFAQWFSESTIAGAILQIAHMGIRLHVSPHSIPTEFAAAIKTGSETSRFCIGRLIRGVYQGLVIYAGRNQYNHLNDDKLHKVSQLVFEKLALNHGLPVAHDFKDPAFDLNQPNMLNYASNILYIMEWKSYEQYENDMRELLGI
jgi:hypothetical protein